MPEQNGNRHTRLDRIERALELMIDDHERFRRDLQQLLTAQVLQKDALEQQAKLSEQHTQQILALREKDAALDARVDSLVSAIGEFICRLPQASR
ncbi:MAG TPA: hypothetical protein VH369_18010 [Bryobacteraceae bacterium]